MTHLVETNDFLPFILMVVSASALPLLAFFALMLRAEFFKGKMRLILLCIGIGLLVITLHETYIEHAAVFTWKDVLAGLLGASLTLLILSKYSHTHKHHAHEDGAKGIVISEAFHSLLDGAVIGTTYLINPLVGYAATIGIIVHELPKIVGTLTLFRGLGLSVQKTILYGIAAQIGSPVAAILVYMLGKKFNEEQFQSLEIASISSLMAIVLWIIYLEIRHHKKYRRHKH
jgi:zinc and cadmium transporter